MKSISTLALLLAATLAFFGQTGSAQAGASLSPKAFNGQYIEWPYFGNNSEQNSASIEVNNNIMKIKVQEGKRSRDYTFDLNNKGEQEIEGLAKDAVRSNGFGARLLKSVSVSNFAVSHSGRQLDFDVNWNIGYNNPIGGRVDFKIRANATIRSNTCYHANEGAWGICLKTRISNIEVAEMNTELSPDSQKAVAIALDLSLKLLGGGLNLFPGKIYNTNLNGAKR